MGLEPGTDVGSGIIRREQVPTGPEIAGGNGYGTDGADGSVVYEAETGEGDDDFGDADDLSGEEFLRRGLEDRELYVDGTVMEIAVANRDEALAFLEGSGLSVRDGHEIAALYNEILGIDGSEGDDSYDDDLSLREDLLNHPEAIDVISDANANDKGLLRKVGVLDETRSVDSRSLKGGLFAGFAGSADDIADLFDRQVERVLSRQDGGRHSTDL